MASNSSGRPRARLLLAACVAALACAAPAFAAPVDAESIPPAIRAQNAAEQKEMGRLSSIIQSATAEKRWADAVAAGRQALAIEEATNGPNHPEVAGTLGLIAGWLGQLDRFAEAEPLLRRSLAIFEKAVGPGHPLTSSALNNLASNLQAQGRYAAAQPLFMRVLENCVRNNGEQSRKAALCYNNLGNNLSRQGRYGEARPYYERALAIAGATMEPGATDLALIENNVGASLGALGRYLEAAPHYERGLAIRIAALGAQDAAVAGSYNNIAFNLSQQGRHAEAATFYERALKIRMAIDPENRAAATATAYNNMAHNLNIRGLYGQAQPLYAHALAIWEKIYGPDHPITAIGYSNVAANLEDSGNPAAAQPLYEKALKIRRAKLSAIHPDVASGTIKLAHNLELQRKFAQAEPLYAQAVAARRAALGALHPDLASGLTEYANLLTQMGPAQQARALALAREAAAIVRQRREQRLSGAAAGTDANAAQQAITRAMGVETSRVDPLSGAFGVLTKAAWLAGKGGNAALRAEAFESAQDLETSAAAQTMAQTAARTAAGTGALTTLVRRQQDLSTRARELSARLLAALARADQTETPRLRDELDAAGRDLSAVDQKLRTDFPDYAAMVQPRALSIADVQKRLRPDEALLLIVPAAGDVFSFAVTPAAAAWNRLPDGAGPVATRVQRLRCQVDPVTCGPDATDAMLDAGSAPGSKYLADGYASFDLAEAYALYRDLIQPVEATLTGAKNIYVAIGGPLSGLPLAVLPTAAPAAGADGADPDVLAKAPWLADRYALTTLPAVSVLRALRRTTVKTGGKSIPFIGYGNPVLSGPDKKSAANRGNDGPPTLFKTVDAEGVPLADPGTLRTLPPLPGTAKELSAMAKTLQVNSGELHLGSRATEAAVRGDSQLGRAKIVAFATHGLLPIDAPGVEQPGLVLTPPSAPTSANDGILAASEVSNLNLSADWVILSACNTASTDGTPGADSLSSLARSFLYAGAEALLASHWRVSDDATAALTVETLRLRGADPAITRAQALRGAMAAVRTGKRADGSALPGYDKAWAHPQAWGPFTVISNEDR